MGVIVRMVVRVVMLVRGVVAVRVVVVVIVVQEVRIDVELGVEVEATQVKHLGHRHFAKVHHFLRGARVHVLEAVLQGIELRRADQVGLADEDLVGKADLAARLLAVVELLGRMLGVHQRDDGVEQVALGDFVVHEKGLGHGAGVGQAGGLDHHALEVEQALALLGRQQLQGAAQVLADGAAHAAVAHLDDLLFGVRDQDVVVDVFFTELVFDDGDLLAVRFGQHAFEQGGFARTEETGQEGGGDQHGVSTFLGAGAQAGQAVWNQSAIVASFGVPARLAALMTTSPLRYSPSGNASVMGWSGAPCMRSLM